MPVVRYIRRTLVQVGTCVTPQDKALVLLNRMLYPLIHYAYRLAGRNPVGIYPLLLWNVRCRTPDGDFLCRRFTRDFEIVSPAYWEEPLRGFFQIQDGVFVDVGAHVGKYTVMVGRRLGSKGKVVAIEPNPANFQALLRNIAINNLKNVMALSMACGASSSKTHLYRHIDMSGYSTHYNFGKGNIEVECRPLDTILENLGIDEVRLMKIDVEGAEMEVLAGAERTLTQARNCTVILEAWSAEAPKVLERFGFVVKTTTVPGYYVGVKRKC